jgi:hypothetical protein
VVQRRNFVWLLTLSLAVLGSQVVHSLAYRLVTPDASARAHELAASGHSYLAYVPLALAVCTVLVAVALAGELRHALSGGGAAGGGTAAWRFAVFAPAIFTFQEYFERLGHGGAFPWTAALQASFVVGLLLQLPFALAAYAVARILLGAVRSLGRWLAGSRGRPRRVGIALPRPSLAALAPRPPALGLGYGSRGPPSPSR